MRERQREMDATQREGGREVEGLTVASVVVVVFLQHVLELAHQATDGSRQPRRCHRSLCVCEREREMGGERDGLRERERGGEREMG